MAKGSVQKKIRGLERVLRKKSKDDPAYEQLTLMIESLKKEKMVNIVKEKEKKNSQKYHMVKFFERKKVTRNIRRLEKRIVKQSAQEEDVGDLVKQKESLEEDLAYIMYYPRTMKYIGLFVNKEDDNKNEKVMKMKKKAREVALCEWAKSKELDDEDEDKVAYAMKVERNSHKRALLKSRRTRDEESDSSDDSDSGDDSEGSSDENNDKRPLPTSVDDSSSGSSDDDSDEDTDKHDKRPLSTSFDQSSSGNSDEDSDESAESSSEEVEMSHTSSKKSKEDTNSSSDSESDEEDEVKDDDENTEEIKANKVIGNKNTGTGVESDNITSQPDPFFLEEDDGMSTNEISQEMHNQSQGRRHDRHQHHHEFGNKWKSQNNRGFKRKGTEPQFAANKTMTKQEARLAKWQSKQREAKESKKNESNANSFSSFSNKNQGNKNSNFKESNKRKFSDSGDRNVSKMNHSKTDRGKSRGSSSTSSSWKQPSQPWKQPSSSGKAPPAPKTAWAEGGGVSAQCVTALTQSKLSGGIVANASNKKIKFD